MNEPTLVDRTFHIIMSRMVETGQAPHFTEIAADLGVSMEEGRQALHALVDIGLGGWLYPGTDLSSRWRLFTACPISIESPSKVNRNGSPNELSSRRRSAGYSRARQSILRRPVSIVANRSAWTTRTGRS